MHENNAEMPYMKKRKEKTKVKSKMQRDFTKRATRKSQFVASPPGLQLA